MSSARRRRAKPAAHDETLWTKDSRFVWTLDYRDRRRLWQSVSPENGLTLRQAMLFYDEENLAELFLELEANGYDGDPPMLVQEDGWPTDPEILSDFRIKSGRLRDTRARLEYLLVKKLVTGRLIATGYSGTGALDEPATLIAADRWRTLKPDFVHSTASWLGTEIGGILVFEPQARDSQEPRPKVRFSLAEVRTWYRRRAKELTAAGATPSRDDDLEAARTVFGPRIPRDVLRRVRRELAPAEWTRLGRRRSKP